MHRRVTFAALLAIVLAACAAGPTDDARSDAGADGPSPGVRVVATTSILGDLVRNVVGDAGEVNVVMEAGVDPHAFEASASDAQRIRAADLVLANGLGLETGLLDALDAAEGDGVPVVRVAEHVDPIVFSAPGHDDEHAEEGEDDEHAEESERDEHAHGELDPHFWFDPVRTSRAVTLIGERIAEVAPDVAGEVRGNAQRYRDEILDLHRELGSMLAAIPEPNRKLVTNHDSLGYLAARYELEVVGTVVPGGTTLADASSRELSELVTTIRDAGVPAIFIETTAPDRLARTVSRELEGQVEVVELFTGSLGEEGSGAGTYLAMMETNARRIADALTG